MNKIIWMADEIIARTSPKNWRQAIDCCTHFFRLIGNPNFSHEVVSPTSCIGPLTQQLATEKFSTIIDLTDNGWLSASLQDMFPSTAIINQLHISRVRNVSDPNLKTSGHLINISPEEVKKIKALNDFCRPLILDDVSFSGHSSELTMKIFGLDPTNTTHGFLILNVGNLGETPGAKTRLEAIGSSIMSGHTIDTSQNEDGWHIKDFVHHPTIEPSLGLIATIHEIIEKDGSNSDIMFRLLQTQTLQNLLFPFAMSFDILESLSKEGKFIPAVKLEDLRLGLHSPNPTLLTSPYFLKHINTEIFRANLPAISELIKEIRSLSNQPEGQIESIEGLRQKVQESLGSIKLEKR